MAWTPASGAGMNAGGTTERSLSGWRLVVTSHASGST
jgi:hypothetical protein